MALDAPAMTLSLQIMLGLVAGIMLAIAHFGSLALAVRWLARGRMRPAMLLHLARLPLLGLALFGLALAGAAALLAGTAAMMAARTVLLPRLAGWLG